MGERVISDFLCRELPILEAYDVTGNGYAVAESSIPFRKQIGCMKCHATMDQFAMTVRNVVIEKTGHQNKFAFEEPLLALTSYVTRPMLE